ncbi:MAG: PAS domain S-box protein [Promethearchaeota archaeon]
MMPYNRDELGESYKELFEHSLDLIYVNDLNGNFLDANDLTLIALGYEREDIANIKFTDILEKAEIERADNVLHEILKFGKQSRRREYKVKAKNGNYLDIETYSIPLKRNNKIYAILGVGKNITDRKKAEQKLKKSADMFTALYKEGPIAAFTWKKVDKDFIFIDFNNAADKITNGNIVNILGHKASEYYINRPDILDDLNECFNKKTHFVREMQYKFEFTNEKKYFLVNYGYVNPDLVIVQAEDITEKRITEEKLKESEKKYRFFYENTPSSIVVINSKGKIIECNPTTELMFGYKKEELVGKKFNKISVIHPDFLPSIIENFQRFIKGEVVHRVDLQMYKKDQSLIWVNLLASLIRIEDEYYVQALFTDITNRKEAEFLINEEITKLKELDKLRKNLISRVAHELKTPLATVCGGAELFTDLYRNILDNEQLELINLIEKGGKRLKYLVDNLIDISRIEYDKFKLKKERIDLSKLISDSTNEMIHFAKERKLVLNLELSEEVYLNIDRIRMEQVLMNLLSNAIKNTPPEGKISVKLKRYNNSVEFSISDTGVGLTTDEINVLFTRFGKIERYGNGLEYINIQGSGLGLFISKEIVALHNGTIRAESEGRNKGSTFIVELPLN